jgi:uncharacterized protein YfaQ (DUF2300 family)
MDAGPRRVILGALLALATGLAASAGADDGGGVAWRRDGTLHWTVLGGSATAVPERVPLGSLWKLFVYAYLSDKGSDEAPYRCAANPRPGSGDEYCCEPGGSIVRDAALARSCAPYFAPARLGIDAEEWRRHWRDKGADAAWLADLSSLAPATEVTLVQLLAALDAVSPAARRQARAALLPVLLEGYGRDAWPALGTGFRFKTFSWYWPGRPDRRLGGGAGWLADGTAVWFGADGTSRSVLTRRAPAIAAALPPLRGERIDEEDAPCIEVRFFARYPIRRVVDELGRPLPPGTLGGRVVVEFENGRSLAVAAEGRLEMTTASGRPEISGRFALDEYVARVIDREGSGEPLEAARALGVAARSYVVQEGRRLAGCWAIDDSSRNQRVGANPPSAAALAAARFSEGLVIAQPVRYHNDKDAIGTLSLKRSVERARDGARFDQILGDAFPAAAYAGLDNRSDCERLAAAESWLAERAPAWQRELRRHPGYEAPGSLAVCALAHGQPYSDQRRGRIYLRDWMSGEGRLTLAHEYIHLAFRFHPSGEDEAFVESTARRLNEVLQP